MRNKLKSVTLINSGDYTFSTIDIDGNVLLSGANGAGKSTFLRAVLFFYNPSLKRADFGIDANKTSFLDYYFPYPQSYLLYEYINQYGRNYVLVFKTKKLRFRFFAIDNYREIDLKKIFYVDGETLEPDMVMMNFRKVSINESDTFVGAEQFQKIIYGQEGRTKKSDLEKYALYNANAEYLHIGNTIKNIFLNHKIDADSIKALLVSNIDEMDRPSVQLEIVKNSIDKFLDKQESIEQFSKYMGISESIAKSKNDYIGLNEQQDIYLLNMIAREYFIVGEQETLSSKMGELQSSFGLKSNERELLETNFSEKSEKLKIDKGILDKDIEEANEYVKEYHEKHIEEKLLKYSEIESLETNVLSIQKAKEILVGKAEDRVKAFDNEVLLQNNKKRELENKEKEEINTHDAMFLKEQSILRETKEQEFEDRSKEYEEDKIKIVSQQNKYRELYQRKKEALVKVQHTKIYEDEILNTKESLVSLKNKQTESLSSSKLLEEQISSLQTQVDSMNKETAHKIDNINLKQNVEIAKIEENISLLNSKIDFHPDSFIAFLDRNNVAHKNQIFSIVKDDILIARDLSPRVINKSNTLYGIEIDVSLSGSLDELKEELKTFKDDSLRLLKEKESLILLIEKESKKAIDKIEKARAEKYREKSELDKKMPLLKSQISIEEEKLKSIIQKAKIEKEKQESLLLDEIEEVNKSIQAYQDKLIEIDNKKEVLKSEIAKKYELFEKEEEHKKDFKIRESNAKKVKLSKLCDNAIYSIDIRKKEMLKNEGISQEGLDKLASDIKKLKKKIVEYKGYEKEINIYKFSQKPKIDKLGIWQEELINIKKIIRQEKEIYDKAIKVISSDIEAISTRNDGYKKTNEGYIDELKFVKQLKDTERGLLERIDILKKDQSSSTDESYLTTTINEYQIHRSSLMQTIYTCKDNLIENVGKLFKKIDRPELLNLIPNRDNTIEEFLRVGADIERFLNEKKIEELIKETISLFKRATRQLTREIEDIQKHTGNINRQLSKIRKGINDLSGISVIDEIDIRLQESENRILLDLAKLKKIHDDYGMDYDESLGEGLFAQINNERTDKEKKADMEMMKVFKSLSQSIESHNKNSLSLDECFEIEFKVSENNNESRWQSTLNGIGSEGTDVIVKILIYVSLLSLTKKESIKDEVDIHCLVDEIGKLSPLYFKEVIDFTNALGIYFVNGMPSEMLVSSFKNHYKLRKIGEKKHKITVATKIIYRVDEEENL
ncbi:MAG: Unknown protein [uncultured Sulfurovum sp.]|uniref:ATP-binding protein n=1 Tax=uncultured Sulfurovum sp. TaxID=269237 RepID=A0A6S6RZY4_9BACT|nr:MAG: Unknown protein [uncultured Sulfurovum sp.]